MNRWTAAAATSIAVAVGLFIRVAAQRWNPMPASAGPGAVAAAPSAHPDEDAAGTALVALAEAHAPDATARILEALALPRTAKQKSRLVAALGETGDESAVAPLTGLLTDGELRATAIQALGRIGGPKARPVLDRLLAQAPDRELGTVVSAMDGYADGEALMVRALGERRKALRDAAANALRDRDTANVRELMRRELDGAEPERLEMALAYYADAVDPSAIPPLARLARDARPAVGGAAVGALVAQGPRAHEPLAALLRENREASAAVLSAARETLSLRPALRDAALHRLREGSVRAGSILDYLAGDLSQEALDALVTAARTAHQPGPLVQALAARGDASSLEALGRLATDTDTTLSRIAVQTLASHADARAKDALVRASGSSDASVRRDAISTLLRIGAPEGTAALEALTASADAGDRAQAAGLLVAFGPPRPGPKLEVLAADHDPSVAMASLAQLMEIDGRRAIALARQRQTEDPQDLAASFVLTRHGAIKR
jgi:HEAT repeat protein